MVRGCARSRLWTCSRGSGCAWAEDLASEAWAVALYTLVPRHVTIALVSWHAVCVLSLAPTNRGTLGVALHAPFPVPRHASLSTTSGACGSEAARRRRCAGPPMTPGRVACASYVGRSRARVSYDLVAIGGVPGRVGRVRTSLGGLWVTLVSWCAGGGRAWRSRPASPRAGRCVSPPCLRPALTRAHSSWSRTPASHPCASPRTDPGQARQALQPAQLARKP